MRSLLKKAQFGATVLITAAMLAAVSPNGVALAQTTSPAAAALVLPESAIKALQEALNKQGIVVKTDGVLSDETRDAIRKYQSQHHLPVTGEPDKATLDKLGVRQSATESSTVGQATPTTPPAGSAPSQAPASPMPQAPAQPGQMPSGMMNCPMMQGQTMQGMRQMMQGQMQGMMQMMQMMQGQMQGMMQMMQMMQGQMQSGQMQQPGQMQRGPTQGGPMQPR